MCGRQPAGERAVLVLQFARGMTHKEIAAHLNVSPHTVRNQLAQVYLKLGVHDKAANTLSFFAVNRHASESLELSVDLLGFGGSANIDLSKARSR